MRSRRLFSSSSTTRMRFAISGCSRLPRKAGGEDGPASRRASNRERTTVQRDETAREREPETRALVLAGAHAAKLPELLEDRVVVPRRDAHARVGHLDVEPVALRARRDSDFPAGRRELHRVRQEVDEDLLELA